MGRTCFILLLALVSALVCPARFVDSLSVVPVKIINNTDEQQVYMLDCDRWATADLTYRINEGPEQHKKTGEFVPIPERDYQFSKTVMLRIVLEPGETLEGELRRTQQPYLGPPPASEEFEVLTEAEASAQGWGLISFGLVAACILLFIFLYNFTFFMVTRNRLYRFYLPGVIFMIFETLRETGVLAWIFADWTGYAMAEQYIAGTLILLIMIFSPLFIYDLMDAPNRFPISI